MKIFILNNYINIFNTIFVIILTYVFFITSIFSDNLIFFNLMERIQYQDTNFKDYLCYFNTFAVYPLYILKRILGFKFAYLLLTLTTGILFSYYVVKIYSQIYQKKSSLNIYLIIFFFYIPFGIGGYYIDGVIYLLSILSLYFFLKDYKYNYIYSGFFLSTISIIKTFHVAPFLISFSIIFLYKFLFKNTKYLVIKDAVIFYSTFLIINTVFFSLYLYLNKIPLVFFYEYQFSQSLLYSTSRFSNFIYKFFFLDFNLLSAIINKNYGIILFYPFIIIFYISIFFLIKNLNKKSHLNKNIFLIFMIFSTSINFIIAGRDLNHKILFFPILFFAATNFLNFRFFDKFTKFSQFLTTIILILYSLFPLNERFDINDIINKKIDFSNFLKFQDGTYNDFIYTHRSTFFSANNIYNIYEQINLINNFFINEFNEKNNEYKLIFLDDESLPVLSTLNKKNCSPTCANFYENIPPTLPMSKSFYFNNFKKFYELENAILIICYINKEKNQLCLKKPPSDKGKVSLPADFSKLLQINEVIDNSKEIFATSNFSIYRFAK